MHLWHRISSSASLLGAKISTGESCFHCTVGFEFKSHLILQWEMIKYCFHVINCFSSSVDNPKWGPAEVQSVVGSTVWFDCDVQCVHLVFAVLFQPTVCSPQCLYILLFLAKTSEEWDNSSRRTCQIHKNCGIGFVSQGSGVRGQVFSAHGHKAATHSRLWGCFLLVCQFTGFTMTDRLLVLLFHILMIILSNVEYFRWWIQQTDLMMAQHFFH